MCDRCHLLEGQIHSYAEENARLTNEISGLLHITRGAANTISGLKGKNTRKRNEAITDQDVMAILKIWKSLLASRASIDLEGARADLVRKALKTFVKGTRTERRRMCMDAVRGLALRPYVGPQGPFGGSVPGVSASP
jgi:hypothetical protein